MASNAAATLFAGPGEMRALCRAFDWAASPLGPVEAWSHSLRTIVDTLLASRHPMFLWWGPELVQIYNDAYRPSFGGGGRHPRALGARGREFWTDIWDIIGPQIAEVMSGGPATWHEDQLVPIERNGRLEDVWWTYSYSPVRDDDGRVGGTLVVCQETTGRVHAQAALRASADERERLLAELGAERELLRSVILNMPAPLALLEGPEHRFTLVNEAFRRVSGGGRDVTGLVPAEAFPELAGTGMFERHDRVYETGEPWVGPETLVRYDRDGTGVQDTWFDLRFEPVRDADGRVVAILNFAIDQTAQVRARREVERLYDLEQQARGVAEAARAEAEAANRAKGEFLAVMSHELRTPLNAIGGYAELMEMGIRGPVTAQQSEDLRRIQSSQRHLLGLINEVLNYAKLETGTVHYDVADVPVREALLAAEALVAPQARAKGLSLAVAECPPGLAARADAEKLRQILVNLLSNAVKFTDAQGEDGRAGRIELSCADEGERAIIHVRDTGVGIPADKLDAIFDPFVQVRADLTRPHEGTGLGLSISRDLARGMGGDLTVESTLGAGSTFTLVLPRSGDAAAVE